MLRGRRRLYTTAILRLWRFRLLYKLLLVRNVRWLRRLWQLSMRLRLLNLRPGNIPGHGRYGGRVIRGWSRRIRRLVRLITGMEVRLRRIGIVSSSRRSPIRISTLLIAVIRLWLRLRK